MELFVFELKQKLAHHSSVEFHSDSDGDGFNFPKPRPNPKNAHLVPSKMKFFNLAIALEQKLGHYFFVEVHGESNGDGFKLKALINR